MGTVLVTGVGSGIGRATTRAFADDGWRVYATDVDTEGLATHIDCRPAAVDVTDEDDVARIFERVRDEVGGLDCLVANAGYCQPGPLEDLPAERVDRSDRYADIYDALEGDGLLGGGPLTVSPERVAATIYEAATADAPAPRYPVGLPAGLALATRWLPRPVQDFGQRAAIRSLAALERFRRALGE
ncbi:SDR family NAD(P)-dependent oxidoreductase [Halorhabdus amylolytica]|uniref:SDR family NAD(P)-dependent oxidoreductase n=1 Tax=Halorhabdus amylolytica TaxID=2559573 RepID=UPI0010AB0752|nr:SDR family NAD(P)-dependent oxidoreductase [Halorhabdus amylolytica]